MTGRMLHDLVAMERKSFRIASQRGFNEMDPPLCGSALMSHNGSRSRHNHATIGASAMKHALHVVGSDSAKRLFPLVGLDDRGKIIVRKRWMRGEVMACTAKRPRATVGLAAWGGPHGWPGPGRRGRP